MLNKLTPSFQFYSSSVVQFYYKQIFGVVKWSDWIITLGKKNEIFKKMEMKRGEIQKNSKRTSNSDMKLHGCKEGATKCGVEKMEM